ncbi:MAG: CapA family protein [Bacillota bacterium]|nr:CapA family protein [Bacillota bacterium]
MRSRRKKKKVKLNLKKFIPFLFVVVCVIGLIVVGIKTLTQHPFIIGGTGELATKGAIEEPLPKEPTYETINIMCGGDIMAHMDQVETAKQADGTYDFSEQFTYVAEYFQNADLSLANIETTFSGDGKYSGYPGFDSPDALAQNVADMGVDVALFANNHMLDTKLDGAKRTAQVLKDAGMTVVGVRNDTTENRSVVVTVKGVKIGIVAYTYETELVNGHRTLNGSTGSMDAAADYINTFRYYKIENDKKAIADEIAWCKDQGACFVICYMHWGNEYKTTPSKEDQEIARYIAEEGADIIFASHPHCVQKAEVMEVGTFAEERATDGSVQIVATSKQVPIFYSVGNFVSNQRTESLKGTYGEDKARRSEEGIIANVVVKVCIDDGTFEFEKVDYVPIWVDRSGSKGNYQYKVIPLVKGFETKYAEFLDMSGHSKRAAAALEEIKSIVNLVTTY